MFFGFAIKAYIGKNLSCVCVCMYTHKRIKDAWFFVFPTELCRQQANVLQNQDNGNVRGIGQDELYLYLYHCPVSCRSLCCIHRLHLCCSWLRIPACCPSICSHCAMLYLEPPHWGVWTRSAFWRGHRQTLKSFKVVCGHYYDKIRYDTVVNCSWVDTRWQQYSTQLHTNSTQNNTV